jgi:hypothetical protein
MHRSNVEGLIHLDWGAQEDCQGPPSGSAIPAQVHRPPGPTVTSSSRDIASAIADRQLT